MSSIPPPDPAPASSSASGTDAKQVDEVDLRNQVRSALKSLTQREPLEPTYKHLLMSPLITHRRPTLPKDNKLYKSIGARLRERVTQFTEHPWDRIAQRQPLDEKAMRAAFTLRENKQHEQEALLKATLASLNPADHAARKRRLEGMAMGLQQKRPKKAPKSPKNALETAAAKNAQEEEQRAERERQQRLQQQRNREAARIRREEEEKRKDEERKARMRESPQVKLQRVIQPIIQALWDMEFDNLQGTNPFRMVIDRENCAAVGAPDYFDVIQTPMNLTYINDKVQGAQYETLKDFFSDIELLISNALLYNSDPRNYYHIAAKQMKRTYNKLAKRLVENLKKKQAQSS